MKRMILIWTAMLLSLSVMLVSCKDEPEKADDTTADKITTEQKDTTAEDTTAEDTTGEDTTAGDTTVQDTTAADTTAPVVTAPTTTPSTKPPVDGGGEVSGGGGLNIGGNHSGSGSVGNGNVVVHQAASTKDAYPAYITTKSGKKLVHTYSDRAVDSGEDNSTGFAYMPMLSTTTFPTMDAEYNNKAAFLEDIKPGFVCNNVIVGYDGYMFYGDTTDDFLGNGFLHGTVYKRALETLKSANDWAESHGKKFYLVIAPNKNTVYPDYMPEGYTMASYRRYDQFIDLITDAGITAIDLRGAMAQSVKNSPQKNLYYKYDTHWNNHAGFIAYTETMKMIQKDYPNVVIHQKSEYQINYIETYMKDQAYYLGYYSYFKDYGPVYTLKSNKTATLVNYVPRQGWGQFAFAYECTSGKDKGFCDKLYWLQYKNEYNTNAPNIYVLRDSYSIAMIPFLKDSFYTSTYNWSFSFESNKQDIIKSKADIILAVVAERNLKNYVNQKSVTD